eukprot:CAMPEP_0182427240 /NCGR_PEP_ID=MMETSP1167-20130531/16192_1 /TAXON_ID=2988 /ORGANISM="Mallomonas Sp, Strain CCMP3275" /LENGTH=299 /DNA_ID=CAMNT_0024609337 /DNA_START=193 /DNA_END=1092 /DNA_ORIENTATION=+
MTKQLGLEHPIVLAPMGGVSGAKLAAAMADTGGLGFVGSGGQDKNKKSSFLPSHAIMAEIQESNHLTRYRPRLGVGLVVESQLDKDPSLLIEIMKTEPRNVWISYGDFKDYVHILQDFSFSDIHLFIQVSSMTEAVEAYNLGVKGIVLRAKGAGGYVLSDNLPPLKEFITDVRKYLDSEKQKNPAQAAKQSTFLIAAGGISSGEGIARCLELGADGVCLGTVLAATEESDLPLELKQKLSDKGSRHVIRENPDGEPVYSGTSVKGIQGVRSVHEVVKDLLTHAIAAVPGENLDSEVDKA